MDPTRPAAVRGRIAKAATDFLVLVVGAGGATWTAPILRELLELRLPESAYAGSSLVLPMLRADPRASGVVLLLLAVAPLRCWGTSPRGRLLRAIAVASAVPAWWYAITLPRHPAFGMDYDSDRLLLTVLLAAVAYGPFSIPAFASLASVLTLSGAYPAAGLAGSSDRALPYLLMWTLFVVGIAGTVLTSGSRSHHPTIRRATDVLGVGIALSPLVMTAISYLVPALAKVAVGWPGEAELWPLFQQYWLKGWNTWIPPEAMLRISSAVAAAGTILSTAALIVEFAPLALGWRRVGRVALVAILALHLAIFAATGIAFWKWMIPIAGVALAFGVRVDQEMNEIVHPGLRGATVLLTALFLHGSITTPVLGWLDVPYRHDVRLFARVADGSRLEIPWSQWNAHHYAMGLSRFYYLYNEPTSPVASNIALSREEFASISAVSGLRDLLDHHATFGPGTHDGFDAVRAAEFDRLIRSYFVRCFFVAPTHPLHRFSIRHFWDSLEEAPIPQKVTYIDVRREEYLLRSDRAPRLIRSEFVYSVAICDEEVGEDD